MDESMPPKPRVVGRPFEKGRSGNPAGRRPGSRNKATLAAAALLAGEAEGLTRRAVELALEGDPIALRLCLERLLPRCRERPLAFRLPPIFTDRRGAAGTPSSRAVGRAMNAVTAALARGEITPGEAATVAAVVDSFVRAIEITRKEAFRPDPWQILSADADVEDDCVDDLDEDDDAGEADRSG
jgi:hypothetical protein